VVFILQASVVNRYGYSAIQMPVHFESSSADGCGILKNRAVESKRSWCQWRSTI